MAAYTWIKYDSHDCVTELCLHSLASHFRPLQGAAWHLIPLGSQDSSVLADPVTSLSSTSVHIIFLFLSLFYFFVLYWSTVDLQSCYFQVYSKVIRLYTYVLTETFSDSFPV